MYQFIDVWGERVGREGGERGWGERVGREGGERGWDKQESESIA